MAIEDTDLANNRALVEAVEIMARAKNGTAAQVALAWLLAQGADILPIPGMRRRSHLQELQGHRTDVLSSPNN